ncbi:MAG: phosphotransferase [Candidatus Hydrogenedentota bacterium]
MSEHRHAPREQEPQAPEVRRARAKRAGGDTRGALRVIDAHLANHPDDAQALFEKSRILYELGDRPASLDAKLKALALKHAATDAAAIADMLMEDGLFTEAETLLRARLDRDDKQFTTRFMLAKLLLFSNRFLEAGDEIAKLYKLSQKTPIVRADYLAALRFALLGDGAGVAAILDRLRTNGAQESRLAFFEALNDFLASGDPDLFASRLATLRHAARSNPLYFNLFRMITPDLFLGAENKLRREFHRVLGDRLHGPKLSGADFDAEELTVVRDVFRRYAAVKFSAIDEQNAGYSGDRVWRAYTEMKGWRENSCLLKLGPKFRIAIEKEKMESFVFGKLHPNFHPQILGFSHGRRVAALRLSWASISDDVPHSLRKLYLDPRYDMPSMASALEQLIKVVLAGWYVRNARKRVARVFHPLHAAAATMADYLKGRSNGEDSESGVISLPTLAIEVPDPAATFHRLVAEKGAMKAEVPYGLHHGDLNSRNILLDEQANICLIDFYKSGPGLILHDLARLEVDFRYEALEIPETYLDEVRWMDTRLARATTLKEISALDVRRSMEKRAGTAYAIRKTGRELFDISEPEFMILYALALATALARLLKYGHLLPHVTDLLLAELADLGEMLGEC